LLLIVVVPLFVFDLKKLHLLRFDMSSLSLIRSQRKTLRAIFEFIPPFLRFVALILLVVAVARPQWGNKYTEINSEGIDIILTLDTSESMIALDLNLNGKEATRMDVIKSVVGEFIDGRAYDRMGMVVFGTNAYTQCPLTLDYDILKGYLGLIEIGIAGPATAVGDALLTSVKRLETSQTKSRIVILLTDGTSNAGKISPLRASEMAAEQGIKVYTIAVGRKGRVPFPQKSMFGGWQKAYAVFDVDEDSLRDIAQKTGGQFFKASDTEALKEVYRTIDQLEKTKVDVKEFSDFEEMYLSFLIPAILLLLGAWVLQRTVFLRIP